MPGRGQGLQLRWAADGDGSGGLLLRPTGRRDEGEEEDEVEGDEEGGHQGAGSSVMGAQRTEPHTRAASSPLSQLSARAWWAWRAGRAAALGGIGVSDNRQPGRGVARRGGAGPGDNVAGAHRDQSRERARRGHTFVYPFHSRAPPPRLLADEAETHSN